MEFMNHRAPTPMPLETFPVALYDAEWRLKEIGETLLRFGIHEHEVEIRELRAHVADMLKKAEIKRALEQLEAIRQTLKVCELINN